jgi:hypothetical protein
MNTGRRLLEFLEGGQGKSGFAMRMLGILAAVSKAVIIAGYYLLEPLLQRFQIQFDTVVELSFRPRS